MLQKGRAGLKALCAINTFMCLSFCVAQPGNELLILLPQPPMCSDYRPEPPLTHLIFFKTHEKMTH